MATHPPSRLFLLDQGELAFLQRLSRAEYLFITDEEQEARQLLRDKLNEVVINTRENRIGLSLSPAVDTTFLAEVVQAKAAMVTAKEKDARSALHERLMAAARFGTSTP